MSEFWVLSSYIGIQAHINDLKTAHKHNQVFINTGKISLLFNPYQVNSFIFCRGLSIIGESGTFRGIEYWHNVQGFSYC